MHKKWHQIIFIGLTLLLAASLLAACNPAEPTTTTPTTTPTTAPTTAAPTTETPTTETPTTPREDVVITFIDNQYDSLWLNNAIAEYILNHGYGYQTEEVPVSTAVARVALADGDVDVFMELWQQNWQDVYDEEIAKGRIENLGDAFEGGPQFWVIPQYTHDQFGINTVADMKDQWENFKDPEDPNKGYFINCITGWQCAEINIIKMEAYGLSDTYNLIQPGSGGAMAAALAAAQKKQQHIFGYYWAPTPLMGMYDWYVLEEPPYDAAVWDKIVAAIDDKGLRPLDQACAYQNLPVDIGIWSGLREKAPDAVTMLENMTVGLEPINKVTAWVEENGVQDWDKAAVYYLQNYEDRWQTWVTDDAYQKIKAALANES